MLNNDVARGEVGAESIDVDRLAEEVGKLKVAEGSVVARYQMVGEHAPVVVAPEVRKRRRPSWGGRVSPALMKASFEEDEQFQCGR